MNCFSRTTEGRELLYVSWHWWFYIPFCNKWRSLCGQVCFCDFTQFFSLQRHSRKRSGRCPLACPPRWVLTSRNAAALNHILVLAWEPVFSCFTPLSHSIWHLKPLLGLQSSRIAAIQVIQLLQLCICTTSVKKGRKRGGGHSFTQSLICSMYL